MKMRRPKIDDHGYYKNEMIVIWETTEDSFFVHPVRIMDPWGGISIDTAVSYEIQHGDFNWTRSKEQEEWNGNVDIHRR